jgi:hypothetical protein
MFTPQIAKKCSHLLNTNVEDELKMLMDDLIGQRILKMKANASDLELRVNAVEIELLTKLKNYRNLLGDAVKHGNNG